MNMTLPPEWLRFVEENVASGRYHSAHEVIGEALRLLQQHEGEQADLHALRAAIDESITAIECGMYGDGVAAFAHLRARRHR